MSFVDKGSALARPGTPCSASQAPASAALAQLSRTHTQRDHRKLLRLKFTLLHVSALLFASIV